MEGGTGVFTGLAGVARHVAAWVVSPPRRLGRAGRAFERTMREPPPTVRPRRRWHV